MITVKNTENLAGVTISGDFDDLNNLVDAIYGIVINENDLSEDSNKSKAKELKRYIDMSERVLGFCYDLRHAYQGDREIEFIDNNMNQDKMKWHSTITTANNLYYKFNYLYPEMFFIMLALNELIEVRIKALTKTSYIYGEGLDKRVIWDDKITIIRAFQSQFVKCVKSTLSESSFSRWLSTMNEDYIYIHNICGQYLDVLNINYMKMNKETRLKKLTSYAKRIAGYSADREHIEIERVVLDGANEYQCPKRDIKLEGVEYPDNILW